MRLPLPEFERLEVNPDDLRQTLQDRLGQPGARLGHLTARQYTPGRQAIEVLLLNTATGGGVVVTAPLKEGQRSYPSLTREIPALHWAERVLGDFFGIHATGHPRWKSLILHMDAWPSDFTPLANVKGVRREPYEFARITGEGVHEIPVGPIHAGIIEPGHFRFSCVGEIISNLEIRLGYQHRGIERRLTEIPWRRTSYLAESASTDTAVANALAHAVALEQLLETSVPRRANQLRTIALELERLASHAADLGGLSADIGYSPGASLFMQLRGKILGLAELLTGTRLQRYYIKPGGVARDFEDARRDEFARQLVEVGGSTGELVPMLLDNPGVVERLQGTGHLRPALAEDFGMVGPVARASGGNYDARSVFKHATFPSDAPAVVQEQAGDALARTQVRAGEINTSLEVVTGQLSELAEGPIQAHCGSASLAPNAVGVGIVEAWRGELIHWVTTDDSGRIARYAIKDPSFNNWTGLAIAVRGNLVPDFPLCNKSFSLSYSGNDL